MYFTQHWSQKYSWVRHCDGLGQWPVAGNRIRLVKWRVQQKPTNVTDNDVITTALDRPRMTKHWPWNYRLPGLRLELNWSIVGQPQTLPTPSTCVTTLLETPSSALRKMRLSLTSPKLLLYGMYRTFTAAVDKRVRSIAPPSEPSRNPVSYSASQYFTVRQTRCMKPIPACIITVHAAQHACSTRRRLFTVTRDRQCTGLQSLVRARSRNV